MAINRKLIDLLYDRRAYLLTRLHRRKADRNRPIPAGPEGEKLNALTDQEIEIAEQELLVVNQFIDAALGSE
jgi:hypothetical protein